MNFYSKFSGVRRLDLRCAGRRSTFFDSFHTSKFDWDDRNRNAGAFSLGHASSFVDPRAAKTTGRRYFGKALQCFRVNFYAGVFPNRLRNLRFESRDFSIFQCK